MFNIRERYNLIPGQKIQTVHGWSGVVKHYANTIELGQVLLVTRDSDGQIFNLHPKEIQI